VPIDSGPSPWLNELGLVIVESEVTMANDEAPVQDDKMRRLAIISHAPE